MADTDNGVRHAIGHVVISGQNVTTEFLGRVRPEFQRNDKNPSERENHKQGNQTGQVRLILRVLIPDPYSLTTALPVCPPRMEIGEEMKRKVQDRWREYGIL